MVFLICCFAFHRSTCGQMYGLHIKHIKWKIPETQFINFKFHAVLSSLIKSCAISLYLTRDVNHPSVKCIPVQLQIQPTIWPNSHLVAFLVISSTAMLSTCLCSSNIMSIILPNNDSKVQE